MGLGGVNLGFAGGGPVSLDGRVRFGTITDFPEKHKSLYMSDQAFSRYDGTIGSKRSPHKKQVCVILFINLLYQKPKNFNKILNRIVTSYPSHASDRLSAGFQFTLGLDEGGGFLDHQITGLLAVSPPDAPESLLRHHLAQLPEAERPANGAPDGQLGADLG